MTKGEIIKDFLKRVYCPWRLLHYYILYSNLLAQRMALRIMCGCSSSAVCPSVSHACLCGSCQEVPWERRSHYSC